MGTFVQSGSRPPKKSDIGKEFNGNKLRWDGKNFFLGPLVVNFIPETTIIKVN